MSTVTADSGPTLDRCVVRETAARQGRTLLEAGRAGK